MTEKSKRAERTVGVRPKFNHGQIVICLLLSAALYLCGCASGRPTVSTNNTQSGKAPVRKVDFSGAPEVKELAERTRQVGNEMYPRVLAVLADDTSKLPQQFVVVFKRRTWRGMPGVTLGTRIRLNAGWVAKNPAGLDMVLIHEMAHVAEHYRWYNWLRTPSYWSEGIADYARYKLGYTNGWRCPECAVEFPHYTCGYACAGAFLLFVDATCGSNVVRQLNAELCRGSYSDKFFTRVTGKSLEELWAEFQKTPAFTPFAAEVTKLYDALGYVKGKPPRGVRGRFRAYLKEQSEANALLREMAVEMKDKPLKEVLRVHAFLRYFEEAAKFLQTLADKGQLPGFSIGELSETWPEMAEWECLSKVHPGSRAFYCRKDCDPDCDPSTFHYIVVQESKDSAWKLKRGWRSAPDGRVMEEYPLP